MVCTLDNHYCSGYSAINFINSIIIPSTAVHNLDKQRAGVLLQLACMRCLALLSYILRLTVLNAFTSAYTHARTDASLCDRCGCWYFHLCSVNASMIILTITIIEKNMIQDTEIVPIEN